MKTPMNELIDKAIAYSRELSTEGYLYESMAVDHIINFEKYYSKGFTECWEWLRRITK